MDDAPVDMKTHYIKRVLVHQEISLKLRIHKVFINDKKVENPPNMQFRYIIESNLTLSDRIIKRNDLDQYYSTTDQEEISANHW